jgi:hypothetical protein
MSAKIKKSKLTAIGFRVNDEVYEFLQAKALEYPQEYLLDPRTSYKINHFGFGM